MVFLLLVCCVRKDLREFDQLGTPGAALDDETETPAQRLTRLGHQVMPPRSFPCFVLP